MRKNSKALAGSLGGKARFRVHGNPGTPAGRRLGGLNSLVTHRLRKTGFQTLREIATPQKSERLAELMGILAGDGHVGMYQTSVITNAETDHEHARHVQKLLVEAFRLPVSLKRIKNSNAIIVLLSSKNACDFLRTAGMSTSNKTRDQLTPPQWVLRRATFRNAFLRGLIDTDGCVYLDRHSIKGKEYSSLCIAFTNASIPLLDFVENTMQENELSPTRWGRHVRLRRRNDVLRYSREIGFSNPKHARKIVV
jgi:hypothetical protein